MGNIHTIAAGRPFGRVFADWLRREVCDGKAHSLADVTVWVPSVRVAALLKEAFCAGQGATLLPRLRPFSPHGEDGEPLAFNAPGDFTVAKTVSPLQRLVVVARMLEKREEGASRRRLLREAQTFLKLYGRLQAAGLGLADLRAAVPVELAEHWQNSLISLEETLTVYNDWLARHSLEDPDALRQKLLRQQAADYTRNPPQTPVIAAGFTDTTPAGAAVLAAVLKLPQGALVLPGVDMNMSEETFNALPPTHPQHMTARLLTTLGVTRREISPLGEGPTAAATAWCSAADGAELAVSPAALAGLTLLEAPEAQSEAEAIALVMRATLEEPGKTCTLVTADRALVGRVMACLGTYGLVADDSGGVPLSATPAGQLARLLLTLAREGWRPLLLARLVGHPLARFGLEKAAWQQISGLLDALLLRGVCAARGPWEWRVRLARLLEEKKVAPEQAELFEDALSRVENALRPLESLKGKQTATTWIAALCQSWEGITCAEEEPEEDAAVLGRLLSDWRDEVGADPMPLAAFTDCLAELAAGAQVRTRGGTHPRLLIRGPMEARLLGEGRVILAGANEGGWPRLPTPDPWLCAATCKALGLPDTATVVGMNAQDFASLAAGEDVFISRAVKENGGETVPSRFLLQMESTPGGAEALAAARARGRAWLERTLAKRGAREAVALPPAVGMAPLTARPKRWSASYTRDLINCPYKAHTARNLGLRALEPLEKVAGGAERGNFIHACLERFLSGEDAWKGGFKPPQAAVERLLVIGREEAEKLEDLTLAAALWPRFERIAQSFVEKMAQQEAAGRTVLLCEKTGETALSGGITLHARVDRLDALPGGAAVVDYKTGRGPSKKDVKSGRQPQFAVEAVLLNRGGYGARPAFQQAEIWEITWSGEPVIKVHDMSKGCGSDWPDEMGVGFENLARHYSKEAAVYPALPGAPDGQKKEGPCKFCDFSGVCRFREWGPGLC